MKKIKNVMKKIYLSILDYVITNRLFLSYVCFAFAGTLILRYATIGNVFTFVSCFTDLAIILILGSFAYLFKPKNRFKYLFIVLFIFYFTDCANSIYYTFYTNFATVSLFASLSQTGEVVDSVFDRLKLLDFVYIPMLIVFLWIHLKLKKSTYYNYLNYTKKSLKVMGTTIIVGLIMLIMVVTQLTTTDYSRLAKQWNREYNVSRFGILLYQGNDIIQSLIPKFNSLFGYDEAVKEYQDFYKLYGYEEKTNQFTNIFEGKNVIFIHMESVQANLFDMSFNGQEVIPNTHKLANEGMYFSNFYPQISVGTSSDTEFTLNTSLMPALSGTVAVSYYDREYITIEKLLKEKGYYTFSMHGNKASMWNREKLHASFGYDRFFAERDFEVNANNTVGLGLSDHDFFLQIMPMLEEIETNNTNYMGTIITLSNHSPFGDLDKYGDYSVVVNAKRYNENTKTYEYVKDDFVENMELGNYIRSVHYADQCLGEFFEAIKASDYFNNTVFVLYGDHDAKISRKQYEKLYNYDFSTGTLYKKGDSKYKEFDSVDYALDKNTPLIIWTKDDALMSKIKGTYDYPMGMYDVLPTIGNMMGFHSDYQLGHDVFTIKNNNVVMFPNGNFLTDKIYYNNTSEQFRVLKSGINIDETYVSEKKKYVENALEVSNNIIVYDLINKAPLNKLGEEEISE